jgi:hypothetical protein
MLSGQVMVQLGGLGFEVVKAAAVVSLVGNKSSVSLETLALLPSLSSTPFATLPLT